MGQQRYTDEFKAVWPEVLGRGRNAIAIWQDFVSAHGFAGRHESAMRFVRISRGRDPRKRAGSSRPHREKGPGRPWTGPMVRAPKTGKYRRTGMFVLTLGYSHNAHPSRPNATTCSLFYMLKTLLMPTEPIQLSVGVNVPGLLIFVGRFWVTAEANCR